MSDEQRTDEARELVDELMDVESGLTAWEMDFVEDLDSRLADRKFRITERQFGKLRQIYDLRT